MRRFFSLRFWCVLLSVLSAFAFPLSSTASPSRFAIGEAYGISPFLDWKTIQTDHFRVTFPIELSSVAQKVANYMEEAHRLLTPRLYWTPRHRVQVVVVDNSDSANGLASPVGRLGMVLMVTPPENWFTTAYYDDWLKLLTIHEYPHFLNMDITRGPFMNGLRLIAGDIYLPNSIWPVWMLEGLAVYMETQLTRVGRGRSPYYEMLARAAVEEGVLNDPSFITLDKINGTTPYFPGGDTPYLFGYDLMNMAAAQPIRPDQVRPVQTYSGREEVLGVLSERSAGRVPFLINGNLHNTIGKDWNTLWSEWILDTRKRTDAQLDQIKTQPLTRFERISKSGYSALGATASPDGKWLAYSEDSPDHRNGLYLRNLETGTTKRITDKVQGVGMSFTPDSQLLIFSTLHRKAKYNLWSDLRAYDLKTNRLTWLSDSLRAKDPHFSPSGEKIVFTQAQDVNTQIVTADIERDDDGKIHLGPVHVLYKAVAYDRVATPKYSPDGQSVVFSLHRNGSPQEEIVQLDIRTGTLKTLTPALDTKPVFNRFPAFDLQGRLYFISDRTGVDNLYRIKADGTAEQITNMTTGVWLPHFGPSGCYASVFSSKGWDIAKLDLSNSAYESQAVTISQPPAPAPIQTQATPEVEYPIQDYSIFPSILPREWSPYAWIAGKHAQVGMTISGFDALDRHSYFINPEYDTAVPRVDLLGLYANRTLGTTISVLASQRTQDKLMNAANSKALYYTRETRFAVSAAYPIEWTYSSLTPSLTFNTSQMSLFDQGSGPAIEKTRYVPSLDAFLSYSDSESYRLSIAPEKGRDAEIGARVYVDEGIQTWKGYIADTEYIGLGKHTVLVPSLKAVWVPQPRRSISDASALVRGRRDLLFNPLPGDSMDELNIRGYQEMRFQSSAATVASMDFRFPISRIFRGWETQPVFLKNLSGLAFAETAVLPTVPGGLFLPSAGGGLRLTTDVFLHVPVIFVFEYHHGFNKKYGGGDDLFWAVNLGVLRL